MTMPSWFIGSTPEWSVYDALLKRGLKDKFTFKSSGMGARINFDLPELGMAINVGTGGFQEAQLKGKTKVVYIKEVEALTNAEYFVERALGG